MMKILLVFIMFFSTLVSASILDSYKYMSVNEAQKKWGKETFDREKFKSSGYEGDLVKAKMAAFIVEKQLYKGSEISIVFKELGVANGYFISDLSPAYVLQRPSDNLREGWQLVFIPTQDGKKVKEVKIVKTCCDSD